MDLNYQYMGLLNALSTRSCVCDKNIDPWETHNNNNNNPTKCFYMCQLLE